MQIDVAGFIRQRLVNHCSTVCTIMVFVEKSIDEQENQAFSSPFLAFPFTVATYFFLYPCDERKNSLSSFSILTKLLGRSLKIYPPLKI